MHRLAPIGLALLGLVLVVPGAALAADDPAYDGTAATSWSHDHKKPRHLCPRCQALEAQRRAGAAVAVPSGPGVPGCAMCGANAVAPVMMGSEAPGVAMLGGTHMMTTEPAPIGVVQASYTASSNPKASSALANGARSPSIPAAASNAAIPPAPIGWLPETPHRPRILVHLLGLDGFGQLSQARADRRAAEHAAIPMGGTAVSPAAELPSTVVHQR